MSIQLITTPTTPCSFVEHALAVDLGHPDCGHGCKAYRCTSHEHTWSDGSRHTHDVVYHSAAYGCTVTNSRAVLDMVTRQAECRICKKASRIGICDECAANAC